MPIYAPTLPPRPDLGRGLPPALVMFRFDLRRVLRQKLGKFFGFAFVFTLLIVLVKLYASYLLGRQAALASLRPLANQFMPQGAPFQAGLMNGFMLLVLWLQAALVGGGLVARDTLHRTRPLMYAHPVRPLDYLLGKALFAAGLPFAILLTFILAPWLLSLAVAGASGPVWPSAPLYLVPGALVIAALMGSVTLGASSLAATPRAGFSWALGILLGSSVLGGVLAGTLGDPRWHALDLGTLAKTWTGLLLGVSNGQEVLPVLLSTGLHVLLWTSIAVLRTRPSEATL